MRDDNYYVLALSNWLTLQPKLEQMTKEELYYIYEMEAKVRRRSHILERIHQKLSRVTRKELKEELKNIEKKYESA